MKLQFLVPAVMAGMMLFSTSCSKDDNKETVKEVLPKKEVKELDASVEGKWVYFSFEKGTTVDIATPTTSNDWDLAFNRYHVKTNSGSSGSANGGALKTNFKNWDDLATADVTASYTVDKMLRVPSYSGGQGTNTTISASPVLAVGHGEGFWKMVSAGIPDNMKAILKPTMVHDNGWLTMDYKEAGKGPSYSYNNWVYVVKTARGKYAKIQLTDYKNAKDKTGFITFKYQLSNDRNEFK